MSTILIRNAVIMTMNNDNEIFQGDVLIQDQRIMKVSHTPLSDDSKRHGAAARICPNTCTSLSDLISRKSR